MAVGCRVWFWRSPFILKAAMRRNSGYRNLTSSCLAAGLPWRRSRMRQATASALNSGWFNAPGVLLEFYPGRNCRFT